MPGPNQCDYWASKLPENYKKVGRVEEQFGERGCLLTYLNEPMRQDLESQVDCEERCSDYSLDDDDEEGQQEVDNCVKGCHEMIKGYSEGAIRYRQTGEVQDANMPMTISPFLTESEDLFGESILAENWEGKVLDEFYNIGCDPDPEVGFRHPHEFAKTTAGSEPEEDPAAFSVHIRSSGVGRCMIDDVFETLDKLGVT